MSDALLVALLAELRGLRLDLAEQRTVADVRLSLLLRATYSALGTSTFTASQLVELAGARLSTRVALDAAIRAVTGTTTAKAKSLGKFLSAHAGCSTDGLRLARVRGSVFRIQSSESPAADTWGN